MSKRVFFGHNDLRFYYFRYRDSKYYTLSILILAITVCSILIFTIIIPQIRSYFSIRQEVVALRTKIKTINENINFMNNLDNSLLDSQLNTVIGALPADKDFASIINTIANVAIRAGVSISDFSFHLNEPNSVATSVKSDPKSVLNQIIISVEMRGSRDGGEKFVSEIHEKLPLVEIVEIKGDPESLKVSMNFYYKDLPNIDFKEDAPILPLDSSKQALIRKLSVWQKTSTNQENIVPIGSSSAVPLF